MKKSVLRAGSLGLDGTVRNMEHHAQKAIPVVKALVALVENYSNEIREWKQGHNVHLLIAKDGRSLSFRPYVDRFMAEPLEVTGVEVSLHISRKQEIPLAKFSNASDVAKFCAFLEGFFFHDQRLNCYGETKEELEASKSKSYQSKE